MAQLYEEVTLARDVPEYNLKQGDWAILVDIVPHPKGGEEGYVLELFNEVEESVNVVIVPKSAIEEEEKEGSSLLGMVRYGGIN
ncbi:DUF4926 domain-containing protein [Microcystis sp. LEGE 08355]|uniref:DUF4926 domain-containing protein n=1 Tax=Microcystis sp. LEGE 08355 TaxID=1828687 RepID=UPI00188065DF|nr:DUF4926 domain-containing protein [Microcystis sp. LEGE 08355]MBE9072569.1 DUF4926 domain-containing protein [Microcystis sp. LEGE 08355]